MENFTLITVTPVGALSHCTRVKWKIDTFQIDTNEQQSISHNLKLINFSGILFGL